MDFRKIFFQDGGELIIKDFDQKILIWNVLYCVWIHPQNQSQKPSLLRRRSARRAEVGVRGAAGTDASSGTGGWAERGWRNPPPPLSDQNGPTGGFPPVAPNPGSIREGESS